jgi:hypothetical protein
MRYPAKAVFSTACAVMPCLLALAVADSAPSPDHGIIHFYEPRAGEAKPADLRDPNVQGAEGIFWWGNIEVEEGVYDWSRVERELATWQSAGKRLDVRLATAHNGPSMTPAWLFDRYHVRRIGRGWWADFENGLGDYVLGPDGVRTQDSSLVVGGKSSVAGTSTNVSPLTLLRLNPSIRLEPGARFNVQFDYRAPQAVRAWIELINPREATTNRQSFSAEPTFRGSRSFTIQVPQSEGWRLSFGFDGPGSLALDNVNCIRLEGFPRLHLTDFEGDVRDWQMLSGARLTRDPAQVISGRASLLLTGADAAGTNGICNQPLHFSLQRGHGYAFQIQYRALTAAVLRYRIICRDAPFDVLDQQVLKLEPGTSGRHGFHYPAFVWRESCTVEFSVVGSGQVVLDDLNWVRWSDRVTCFPDYFNGIFAEKWARFITRFAERYDNHPGIGTVSVGGFGRWEETILDDDAYGGLDPQWLARGFTHEKYLARITDCMDLHRRLLPDKPLRICLAFGLHQTNDRDWLYRRVAQAAVARGIGLTQNGLSEKWDTWDDNTSASYLWNRYRFTPGVTLTLETGGQISRPGPGAGHPISFLNRGMIDGTDILFLYGSDTKAQQVNRHLRWTTEQLGRPVMTSFFCRLGDVSLTHEHSPAPLECRNLWLGLRQFQADSASVLYTNRLGERCAATSTGNPRIVFDVDDRQQYHGMYGVVVSVKYLDEGADRFDVTCFNSSTAKWETLGSVIKTGSGGWKVASFLKSDWCHSPRNGGEDVHADLAIEDGGDGPETIADVELHFIPAREWQRTVIASVEPGTNSVLLTNTLSRVIALPVGDPVQFVAVPIWTGELERNGLRGRMFAMTTAGERLVAEKDYVLPADKDWFELPVVPEPGCTRYRLELSQPAGRVGWYRAADGELAYRAWRYAATNTVAKLAGAQGDELTFDALEPFCGLSLALPDAAATNVVNLRLRRQTGNSWPEVQHAEMRLAGGFHFEPQTPGRYRLELTPPPSAATTLRVTLHTLQRREPARPPLPTLNHTALITLAPTPQQTSGLEDARIENGLVSANLVQREASLDFLLPTPLQAASNQVLILPLRNATGANLARIYWAGTEEEFSPECSTFIPLVTNDTELRTYECRFGLEAAWRGKIVRLRLEPASGLIERGRFTLGRLEVAVDRSP